MSHFTVLVISGDPSDETLTRLLNPFDEQPDDDNARVLEFNDCTEEVTEKFKSGDFKGEYDTLKQFAEEYYGYVSRDDGRFGYLHNPNAKWDWWVVGGRWSGMLRAKNGSGMVGQDGVMGSHYSREGVDQVQVKDLDLDAMLTEAREHQGGHWDESKGKGGPFAPIPEGISREEYVNQAEAFSTFAVLKDGEWYERGSMGWWAMVSDEKEEDEWDAEFQKLVTDLPPDTWLSVVDCHI